MNPIIARIVLPLPLLAACGASAPPAATTVPVREVHLAAVRDTTISRPVTGTGVVAAKDELPLSFKVGGVVTRVLVDAGSAVRAGQLLAELDQAEIGAGVDKAKAALAKAERDLARADRLYRDSVATLAQRQDAATAVEVARADLQSVAFNQGRARILAPTDGVVLRRAANAGELVNPGTPILQFASAARGQVVRIGLADRDAARVRVGDPTVVRFEARPGERFPGQVREVSPAADPRTGTFAVEVTLPGTLALPSGLVGDVEIRPRAAGRVALVPVEAIVEANGEQGVVFTAGPHGGRVTRRQVRIAFLDGARVGLAGGLGNAAHVVTDGSTYLDEGDSVAVAQ